MEENKEIQEQEVVETAEATEEVAVVEETSVVEETQTEKRPAKKSRRRKIETVEPVESEWKEQVVQIRRVTKVVKGGKKLSFRAIVIVGNKKGQVGMGVAKAAEVIIAIQKAVADARKNLVTVPLFNSTIPHMITGRSGAGSVILRPASKGTGVIAGGAVRAVLELAGIENISDRYGVEESFEDRYGEIPNETYNLLEIQMLRVNAQNAGIKEITHAEAGIIFKIALLTKELVDKIALLASKRKGKILFGAGENPYILLREKNLKGEALMESVNNILKCLQNEEE